MRPYIYRQGQSDEALIGALEASNAQLLTRLGRLERRLGRRDRSLIAALGRPANGDDLVVADLLIGEMLMSKSDFITEVVIEYRMWEPDLSVYLSRLLRPGMTFVDIGANFGYFSVMASKLVRASGRVLSVEPEATNRSVLQGNLWRNGCTNAEVLPVAAYSTNGHICLMMNPMGGSGHWLEPEGGTVNWGGEDDATPGALVPCVRLDDALSHRPVDVVKIDAQGADHLAVLGMEQVLRASPDVMVIAEFLPLRPAVDGESPDDVLRCYEDLGFELNLLAPDGTMNQATRAEIIATGETLDVQNLGLKWRSDRRRPTIAPEAAIAATPTLERALQDLEGASWSEPSEYGRLGRVARKALRRALKPYAVRQAALDAAILGAIRESSANLNGAIGQLEREAGVNPEVTFMALASVLDPNRVVEGDTEVGMLWVHRDEPLISGHILATRTWEPNVGTLLRSVLRPGMTFIDVGANVGFFSALAAEIVGEDGHIVAVEADPANAAIVRANLWRRGCRNARVLEIAAYSQTGHVRLMSNPDAPTNTYITENADELEGRMVPCARLDDVLEVGTVDVVKVDAEGSDHHVVRGMNGILARSPNPVVVVEIFLAETDLGQERPVDILASYRDMGFTHHLIDAEGNMVAASADQVLASPHPLEQLVLTRS